MTTEETLKQLLNEGFQIEQIGEDSFKVEDNGKFGFINDEGSFVVDGEDLLEIYEVYVKSKK